MTRSGVTTPENSNNAMMIIILSFTDLNQKIVTFCKVAELIFDGNVITPCIHPYRQEHPWLQLFKS